MGAQGLLDDPESPATRASLLKLIRRLGFVQMDTINVVERAHHLTLHTRMEAYRKPLFERALEKDRSLFEHWTHDASAIPVEWFPHWKPRFRRDMARLQGNAWWQYHF
ncbi:MAG: winged helix DNA-binding domain-containing protein, partial [Acidobacteriota bacterium]|nr:winged helix DNA-binding domain-containing protein [Acidobacteriota bacterium]